MTTLTITPDDNSADARTLTDYQDITRELNAVGVMLEKWEATQPLAADADQDAVTAAYADEIDRLKKQFSFKSVDVVSLRPDNPQKAEFRKKFLSEHTHDDFEIRFFVDGSGLFYLHINNKVYMILCEAGDLISVPANTTHWFDMGENPNFKCIRFFTTDEGWVGKFTGSDIATRFPNFDEHRASLT